jgi:hypothetical protein
MLHASDILIPKGRLNPAALWPGQSLNDVSATVEEYLADGYIRTADDEAARWWAYYRAWDEKWQTLSAMPSSVSVSDEGSSGYTQGQIDSWHELAKEAKAEFDVLVAAAAGEEAGSYSVITSYR